MMISDAFLHLLEGRVFFINMIFVHENSTFKALGPNFFDMYFAKYAGTAIRVRSGAKYRYW